MTNIKGTLILTAAGGWPSTTSGCAARATHEAPTNKQTIYYLAFDNVAIEKAEWGMVMPDNWDGLAINAAFYWMANDATTNSVKWGLEARAYGDGAAIDQDWGTGGYVIDANGGTAYQERISAATPNITVAGAPAGGQQVQARVTRLSGLPDDTLAVDALLLGVKIEFGLTADFTHKG